MAARTRKVVLDERWRERIRTSMLINRLQDHIFNGVAMSSTQIRAAEVLLKKVAPDLSASELTGKDGSPLLMDPEHAQRVAKAFLSGNK